MELWQKCQVIFSKICLMNFMTLQLNKLQTKKNQHHLVDGILTAVIIQNLLIKIISEIIIRINYQLLSNAQIAEKNKNWASRNWASRNAPNHTAAKRRETRKNTTSLIAHSPPKSATNQPKTPLFGYAVVTPLEPLMNKRRAEVEKGFEGWSGEGITCEEQLDRVNQMRTLKAEVEKSSCFFLLWEYIFIYFL